MDSAHAINTKDILVARQPIYNSQLKVVAYELLYRDSSINGADFENGTQATSSVIVNTFLEIGFETLVGSHQAFINFPRNLLLSPLPYSLPVENTVIEILEDVFVDDELLEALSKLSLHGYKIALDDFGNCSPLST